MQSVSNKLRLEGKAIALVPTMGFLHEGHASLIKKAKELCDIAIVSVFVNPTQFAPNEDFEKYPRNFEHDKNMIEDSGGDYIFYPTTDEMYPAGFNSAIVLSGISKKFEGSYRPNHFNGVATIVAKFFNACLPHIAVFGQKDFQQTLVVKQLVRDFNLNIKIVVAATMRESDGLAMSSRNVYLDDEERVKAAILYKALEDARAAIEANETRRKVINAIMHNRLRSFADIMIDYASATDAETLEEPDDFLPGQHIALIIAVHLGKTRLIDNAIVTLPEDPNVRTYFFEEV